MIKIMGSSTPAYKNGSYVRSSSIRRVNFPSTPRNQDLKPKNSDAELKGLLSFEK
jgi:hypothetical protein